MVASISCVAFGNIKDWSSMNIFTNRAFAGVWWMPPQPPAAPRFLQAAPATSQEATAAAILGVNTGSASTKNSIGQSPVVQSFLMHLQEFGMTHIEGTDGND